jgi:hypothetical protein
MLVHGELTNVVDIDLDYLCELCPADYSKIKDLRKNSGKIVNTSTRMAFGFRPLVFAFSKTKYQSPKTAYQNSSKPQADRP